MNATQVLTRLVLMVKGWCLSFRTVGCGTVTLYYFGIVNIVYCHDDKKSIEMFLRLNKFRRNLTNI